MNYIDAIKKLENNKLMGLNVIYGEEDFLIDFFIDVIKKDYIDGDFFDFNYQRLDMDSLKLEKIIEAGDTLPLMSNFRFLEVRGIDFSREAMSKDKDFFKGLESYSKENFDGVLILLVSKSGKFFNGSFFKALKKEDRLIEIDRLSNRELENFISKQLQSFGISKIKKDILDYFIEKTGYYNREEPSNLYEVYNKCRTLASFCQEKPNISVLDVDKVFPESHELSNIFKLIDKISIHDEKEAIRALNILLSSGNEERQVFAMLIRHLRNLLNIKTMLKNGVSVQKINSYMKLKDFEFKKLLGVERNFSIEKLKDSIEKAFEIEVRSKSVNVDFKIELMLLVDFIERV